MVENRNFIKNNLQNKVPRDITKNVTLPIPKLEKMDKSLVLDQFGQIVLEIIFQLEKHFLQIKMSSVNSLKILTSRNLYQKGEVPKIAWEENSEILNISGLI